MSAVGDAVPPIATINGSAWAAKPTPPVVLAVVPANVTVPEPAVAVAAKLRVNSPLICNTATDEADVGVSSSGLFTDSAAESFSARIPSLSVVLPVYVLLLFPRFH
ncbi:MAG: hypothetical protein QM775_18035 [Pirellulales bacterium]